MNMKLYIVLLSAFLSTSCAAGRRAYYDAWESVGYAKRERLVDDVKRARDEQVEAKEQFATALAEFKSVVGFDGGDLEKTYEKLNSAYEDSERQAGQVKDRIKTVKRVADALFDEWSGEIDQIEDDPELERSSRKLFDQTRASYGQMIKRMDRAAATMDPVLKKLRNRVIFIKSNLNAQAIASLAGTEVELGTDIEKLIREMEASIAEADAFIGQTQGKK